MRVTTAFNRLLALPGARVIDVRFGREGVFVVVALWRRRVVCSACGQVYRSVYDRSWRRWRHLDLGGQRCFIAYQLRRVNCADCGVRVEALPFARVGARHTRDMEDLVAFCAQQLAKTQVCALLRIAWDTVGSIIERVLADQLNERRLQGLIEIGIDEISYRRGMRFLTCVADHRSGALVWAAPGKSIHTLKAFFAELGEHKRSIKAISIDMNGAYEKAIRQELPDAEICFDPFHVIKLANKAVDLVRRAEWNAKGKSATSGGRWVKHSRWSLLKAPQRQNDKQLAALAEIQRANHDLYRAFLLKEQLRELYHLHDPTQAAELLDAWTTWASRSRLAPFQKLARTITEHRDGILAAIRLDINNARLEGLNNKIRLISHRSYGFHSAPPLIALIYLSCSGLTITPPQR